MRPAVHDRSALQHAREPVDVALGHDPREIRASLGVGTVEFAHRRLARLDKGVGHALMHIDITWRDAPLAAERIRAPDDLLGRERQISGLVHDDRIHAA